MIQDFVQAWDANKDRLKEYIGEHLETGLGSYQLLVKALFEQVINPYLKDSGKTVYNLECIHEIVQRDIG